MLAVMVALTGCSSDADGTGSTTGAPTTAARCVWRGSAIGHEGAGGHSASVLSLTNVSDEPCAVPTLTGVRAVDDLGSVLAVGAAGGFFPVEPLGVASIAVGGSAEFVLTTTSQDLCGKTEEVLTELVRVTLSDGTEVSVAFPWTLNVACGVSFTQATRWIAAGE